jgi:hypothetical protein
MDPVVALVLVLVAVLVMGQFSVDLFSLQEGLSSSDLDPSAKDALTTAKMNYVGGPGQSQVDVLFDKLQARCNTIKTNIDEINKSIPRAVSDISVKSVAFVPWESKDMANIQITRVPYKFNAPTVSAADCSCNYGCQWQLTMTLPVGPTGKPGSDGPQGPPGQPGQSGLAGAVGARGNRST